MAALGPSAVAGAHFVQSMALLHFLPTPAFGAFAFLLVVAALSWALWGALFCAPLANLVNSAPLDERSSIEQIIGATNLIGSLVAALLLLVVALLGGLEAGTAIWFASFASLSLLRWFGRAHAFLHGRSGTAFASDLAYASVLLTSLAGLWQFDEVTLTGAYASMSLSALIALFPFGARFVRVIWAKFGGRAVQAYFTIAGRRAGWSFLGVMGTELTANSHAYVVALWAGTEAYAPIAATALLVRPMSVASAALRDLERPRLARLVSESRFAEVFRSLRVMRVALALVWVASLCGVVALFAVNPRLLFPTAYSLEVLWVGAALWVGVSGLAMLRVPEGALLQAVGKFRSLAIANAYSAVASVAAVVALMAVAGPVWSIAGIFVGQAVNAVQIALISRSWRRQHSGL